MSMYSLCIHLFDFLTDIDVKKMKQLIRKVLTNRLADLSNLPKVSLGKLATELYSANLISIEVQKEPTFDAIIGEFMAGLAFKRSPTELEEHLKKFLTCLKIIRGSFGDASSVLQDEWTEIFQKELSLQVNLKMS